MTNSVINARAASIADLKEMTDARVALGRFGAGTPTKAAQAFLLDHARAREAVWSSIDQDGLQRQLIDLELDAVVVESLAGDRSQYVRRPDLGRKLSATSVARLEAIRPHDRGFDVVIVVADGLSSSAVDINAVAVVGALAGRLARHGLSLAPVVIASQARVALSDPIGEALAAKTAIMLIGERPGLSAADSLGAYVTHAPRSGTPDSRRNCVSNIREGGLPIAAAVDQIAELVIAMRMTGISGVGLKDAVAKLESAS